MLHLFTINTPLSFLYTIYVLLFSLYLFVLLYLAITHIKKISLASICMILLSAIVCIIKITTSYMLDARTRATLDAIHGINQKHSYPIMLIMDLFTLFKPPHFNYFITYNMLLGSILVYITYAYFSLIVKNKIFGCICAVFVATHSLIWQATISSEYFLIQWLFAFTLLFALHYMKQKSPNPLATVLFFLSYLLLALSKVEMFILLGAFFMLPLILPQQKEKTKLIYLCYGIGGICVILCLIALLQDIYFLRSVTEEMSSVRTAIQGIDINKYCAALYNNMYALWHNTPSFIIAAIFLGVIYVWNRKIIWLDLPFIFLCYVGPFLICFFVHREGFAKQEGDIKFFCIIIPLLIYVWCTTLWNLLHLYRTYRNRYVKIVISILIAGLVITHIHYTRIKTSGYIETLRTTRYHPFGFFHHPNTYLHDTSLARIQTLCSLLKETNSILLILDAQAFRNDSIYQLFFRYWIPPHTYLSLPRKKMYEHIIQVSPELIPCHDIVLIINAEWSLLKSVDILFTEHSATGQKINVPLGPSNEIPRITLLSLSAKGDEVIRQMKQKR